MERDRRLNRRFFVADGFTELEAPGGFTFGRRQLDLDPTQRFMSEAPLGFAVAAPILGLAEGDRTITLLAHLLVPPSAPPVVSQAIGYALDVTLTGPKAGWCPTAVQASLLADDGSGQPALSVTAKLGAAAAAVVAFDPALHGPGPSIGRPLAALPGQGRHRHLRSARWPRRREDRAVGGRQRRAQSRGPECGWSADRQSADAAVRQSAAARCSPSISAAPKSSARG